MAHNTTKQNLKLLLIQMRKSIEMLPSERNNFLRLSGLAPTQLTSLDVYRNPIFEPGLLDQYDGFFVGGLSDDPSDSVEINSALYPFIESFHKLLERAEQLNLPGLLSCGGFMLASSFWGGEIALDTKQQEMGIVPIILSKEAKNDVLLSGLPQNFKIVSGHIKSTLNVPASCLLMGSSERCSIHIIKRKGQAIYAFQGHPEITCNDLKERVYSYKEKYFDNDESFQAFLNLDEDTSFANQLVRTFIEKIKTRAFR